MPSSLFCFGLLLLGMCLLLTVVCFPSKTPLGKIHISFLSGNQLEIDIRLGMEVHVFIPSQNSNSLSGTNMYRHHAC